MSYKREAHVEIRVLSPQPISEKEFLEALLDMEMAYNAQMTRFRIHVGEPRKPVSDPTIAQEG